MPNSTYTVRYAMLGRIFDRGGRKQSLGKSGTDKTSAGDKRKARLAAELRANLKRRKAKTGDTRAPKGKEPDETGSR